MGLRQAVSERPDWFFGGSIVNWADESNFEPISMIIEQIEKSVSFTNQLVFYQCFTLINKLGRVSIRDSNMICMGNGYC